MPSRTTRLSPGTPVILAERIDDAVTNVIVIGCGVENLPGKACDCVQQIGAGYDSHEPFTAYHRQPFDPPVLHQGNDFLERRILGDGYRITCHDFGYPSAIFLKKSVVA
jgi:hypothetical protein